MWLRASEISILHGLWSPMDKAYNAASGAKVGRTMITGSSTKLEIGG